MVKREVISALLDSKKVSVLKVLLNSSEELYLKEIAEKSNVSITSTFRLLQDFVNQDLIEKKLWKTSKIYLCKKNEKVNFLKELLFEEFDGVQTFLDSIKEISEIKKIILQGKKTRNKANLLLIGENINQTKIDEICKEIKNQGFELSYFPLTEQQYEQMTKMGLYSGEKKVLKN